MIQGSGNQLASSQCTFNMARFDLQNEEAYAIENEMNGKEKKLFNSFVWDFGLLKNFIVWLFLEMALMLKLIIAWLKIMV